MSEKNEIHKPKVTQWLLLILIVGGTLYFSVNANNFPEWTGFPQYDAVANGDERQQTFIDWLDLLLVPVVIAVAAYLYNLEQKKKAEQLARLERESYRATARDRQQQNTLDRYLEIMTGLILEKGLGPDADDDVKRLARTHTLVVLRDLDAHRNQQVIQFLQDQHLLKHSNQQGHHEDTAEKRGGIDLSLVNLREVNLGRADLRQVDLRQVDLSRANLSKANLSKANLSGANLSGADLNQADLTGADLSMANLNNASSFYREPAELGHAILPEANLSGANLIGVNLSGAVMNKTDLGQAKLMKADLREAFLMEANLKAADLSKTDLSKAILVGADLSGAVLNGANLRQAFLNGANLSQAELLGADLSQATCDKNTRWPANFDPTTADVRKLSPTDVYAIQQIKELGYAAHETAPG